jgi:dATP pyrophosphohydrolase
MNQTSRMLPGTLPVVSVTTNPWEKIAMRAPFQVLVLPYRRVDDSRFEFAIFRRSDLDFWQGIAGGGEDEETSVEAARREAREEAGLAEQLPLVALDSIASVPVSAFRNAEHWPQDRFVIPEYAFGVDASGQTLLLSHEHTDLRWLPAEQAQRLLHFDSNRVALGELQQRLGGGAEMRTTMSSHDPSSYQRLGKRVAELRGRGICPTCHDLATGELFGDQSVILDDDRFRVALEQHPRARGHTIIIYKPHRDDFTELTPDETSALFGLATRVANALKQALGAEKVYLVTMCDGMPNHLHLQLLPRLPGEPIGSRRFTAPRGVLEDGERLATAIRAALERGAS